MPYPNSQTSSAPRGCSEVNPDADAKTHAKTVFTGKAENKLAFRSPRPRGLAQAAALAGIKITQSDIHIGSQITDLHPPDAALD